MDLNSGLSLYHLESYGPHGVFYPSVVTTINHQRLMNFILYNQSHLFHCVILCTSSIIHVKSISYTCNIRFSFKRIQLFSNTVYQLFFFFFCPVQTSSLFSCQIREPFHLSVSAPFFLLSLHNLVISFLFILSFLASLYSSICYDFFSPSHLLFMLL